MNSLFAPENLFAWCVASHDGGKRSPEQRAEMMKRLGFTKYAWGNRMAGADCLPAFHAEMDALKKHGIELIARWLPTEYNEVEMKVILDAIEQHGFMPELWISGWDTPTSATDSMERFRQEVLRIEPFAIAAQKRGLKIGLYNHDGWFGVPANRVSLARHFEEKGLPNVRIVQNLHWSHEYLDRFEEIFALIQPYLSAFILNGTVRGTIDSNNRILPVGAGEEDLRILKVLEQSGWNGLIGVMNHTDTDSEARLADNLDGLSWLQKQGRGEITAAISYRTWRSGATAV